MKEGMRKWNMHDIEEMYRHGGHRGWEGIHVVWESLRGVKKFIQLRIRSVKMYIEMLSYRAKVCYQR